MYRKRKISNIKTTNNKQGGKEMKRKLVSVLLSVSLVAAMVMGCSNGDGDKKSSSTKTESTSNKKGGHKFGYTCMDGTNPFFVTLEDERGCGHFLGLSK